MLLVCYLGTYTVQFEERKSEQSLDGQSYLSYEIHMRYI